MNRWVLASRLSDALELALPRGCRASIEVPARSLPDDPKDPFVVVTHVKYQDASGGWQTQRIGASVARLTREPDAVIEGVVRDAVKRIEKSRSKGAAA